MTKNKPKQSSVTDPGLEAFTKHIRPFREEEWDDRAPSEDDKREIIKTYNRIKPKNVRVELDSRYKANWFTLANANESWVENWIHPKNRAEFKNGDDINKLISLTAREGFQVGSGEKFNLMTARRHICNALLVMYNTQKKNIRFIGITDSEIELASSTTKHGERPKNFYLLDFIQEKQIDMLSSGNNKQLDEFDT